MIASACQVTTQVDVRVRAGGDGVVSITATLDRDAARSVPDLASELQVSDLTQAGWHVDGPHSVPGGGMVVVASKPFRTPAEASQVLAEVSGSTGPFHDLHVSRQRSWLGSKTTVRVNGTVDLTCGLQCFSDPALQQQLGGALAAQPAAGTFGFGVRVHVPGKTATWPVKLGEKTTVAVSGQVWSGTRLVVGAIAVVAVIVMVAGLAWFGVRRRRRRPVGRHGPGERRGPVGRPGPASTL